MMGDVVNALTACLDPGQLISDPDLMMPYLREVGARETGAALAVARPSTTQQVAAVTRACAANGVAIVPQGGNTGLTGASLPRDNDRHLLLSLSRMKAVRIFNPQNAVIVAEAGCVLSTIQEHVASAGLVVPLGLGSEGSCTIGGMAATNAGGIRALRYGNTRENILGLEVVLPDGSVFDGLRMLRKHNMGYDLKHLFIGSEGTLGIITAVALRLNAAWRGVETALVALADLKSSLRLLDSLRSQCGDTVLAFEIMDGLSFNLATAAAPHISVPFETEYAAYALIDVASQDGSNASRVMFEQVLATALEDGMAVDAIVASNEKQRNHFWELREAIITGQRRAGASVKFDVSIPIGSVAEFIEKASATARLLSAGSRPIAFGHVGDGNIHFSIIQPEGVLPNTFMEKAGELTRATHDLVLTLGGSISAEHGIGRYKRDEFERIAAPVEIDLMQRIKQVLDPRGMMNPGALLREPSPKQNLSQVISS